MRPKGNLNMTPYRRTGERNEKLDGSSTYFRMKFGYRTKQGSVNGFEMKVLIEGQAPENQAMVGRRAMSVMG